MFDLWKDVHGPNYSVTCVPYADGSQGLHAKSSFTIKLQIRIFLSRTTIAKTKARYTRYKFCIQVSTQVS